jgi:hypothetical protein
MSRPPSGLLTQQWSTQAAGKLAQFAVFKAMNNPMAHITLLEQRGEPLPKANRSIQATLPLEMARSNKELL